jgi:hypothetical protein
MVLEVSLAMNKFRSEICERNYFLRKLIKEIKFTGSTEEFNEMLSTDDTPESSFSSDEFDLDMILSRPFSLGDCTFGQVKLIPTRED